MSDLKKLFIKTYGCQMNVYDSERMAEAMAPEGYIATEDASEADLVLLNTCHIREKAGDKLYSDLGRLRPLKDAKPDMKIGVAGCIAQAEGAEIMRRVPMVDLVVGPQAYHRLPALVRGADSPVDTDFPVESKFDLLPARKGKRGPTAFLTVQEGCDKFCAFCVVPYTRGAEVSRPVDRVLAEAQGLVERGVKDLTLLGQNVNAYHGQRDGADVGLAQLLGALAKIDGLERLRYTTSHPNDMADDLIEAHGTLPKLMPYLHLPVQSGSDRILKAMNRKHSAESYLRLIERFRAARPDILLTSDFIVGFPGETDADFEATLALIRQVGFGMAYSFKYSARPGTPAAGVKPQVPDAVKTERLHLMQQVLDAQLRTFNISSVGKTFDILLTNPGRYPGQLVGRSPYLQAVHVMADPKHIGEIVPVKVVSVEAYSLGAVWADALEPAASV